MKETRNNVTPPRWAEKMLNWYCKPDLVEDLQGDLNEYFHRNVKRKGAFRARLIYIIDVIKFFRPYTVRKPELINLLIHWIMIGSYIKTSGRNIVRNTFFSSINIFGLAISMSVGLLMIAVLNDVLSYDKFNDKHDRIFRVISQYQYLDRKDDHFVATTSLKAAQSIEESFTGPEEIAILQSNFRGDVKYKEKTIPLRGFWSNESFFRVFSYNLLQGNPRTALKHPFSIVLTETSATKLFGKEEALGKTLTFNDKEYTITGVIQDIPKFSHIQFEMLGSLSTKDISEKDDKRKMAWDNMWNTWVYILMREKTDLNSFQQNLNKLSEREDKTVAHTHITLALQPLDDIVIGENLGNQIGPVMGKTTVLIFAGLAFVVILSACFNYTNLSVARALRRGKEVGIRKTVGALKAHVVAQFLIESIIISMVALVFAFLIFVLVRPHFITIEPSFQRILVLDLSPRLVAFFIVFAIVVGISAGFFPALFFSRINAINVLKNLPSLHIFKKITMRKVLIVIQYSVSIIFITATLIAYKQYKHFISYDLGFNTENILNLELQGNKAELLKKELYELPEVKGISQSCMITSVGNYYGTMMKYYKNPLDSAGIYYNFIDENYLPLHNHKLISGRNFKPKVEKAAETEVIVNQQVLKRFNIAEQKPEKAIGEVVRIDDKDMQIIGVMKDFEYGRANNNSGKEVVFRYSQDQLYFLNIKLQSYDLVSTYSKIESIWKKIDSVHPLTAKFYNDEIEESFSGLKASVKVAGFLAVLAICIASLGLLGMVVYTTETRMKEISIRKVMGATEGTLIYLLGKGFLLLLLIAAAISLPITYLFFDKIMFTEIANHAPLGMTELFAGVIGIMLIAIVMIASQTLKVARANPAEVLKNE